MNSIRLQFLVCLPALAFAVSLVVPDALRAQQLRTGDDAPAFSLPLIDETEVSKESLKGKYAVLEFWGTWCAACIPALEHLSEVARETEDLPVHFVGAAVDSKERLQRFLSTRSYAMQMGYDTEGEMSDAFGIGIVPTTVILDPAGKVAAVTRPESITAESLRAFIGGNHGAIKTVHRKRANIDWRPETTDEGEVYAQLVIAESDAASGGTRMKPGSGRITSDGIHLLNLIQIAYNVKNTRLKTEITYSREDPVYRLFVQAPAGDDELARKMLQAVIRAKFSVTAQWREETMPAMFLQRIEGAEPLAPSTRDKAPLFEASGGGMKLVGQPFSRAVFWFENLIGKPVIDQTGYDDVYDLELEWVDRASFLETIKKVGLELVEGEAKVRVLEVKRQ